MKEFDRESQRRLLEYDYPGNVRELKNIVEGAYYTCPQRIIRSEHLPMLLKKSNWSRENRCAAQLYAQMRSGVGSFEDIIRQPFVRREINSEVVREVLKIALNEADGRYKDAFRMMGVAASKYSTLMLFLKRHRCFVNFRQFRERARKVEGARDLLRARKL